MGALDFVTEGGATRTALIVAAPFVLLPGIGLGAAMVVAVFAFFFMRLLG